MANAGSQGYPEDLEMLVRGAVDAHGETVHFLDKVPVDPVIGTTDWGTKALPRGRVAYSTFTQNRTLRLWTAQSKKIGR